MLALAVDSYRFFSSFLPNLFVFEAMSFSDLSSLAAYVKQFKKGDSLFVLLLVLEPGA